MKNSYIETANTRRFTEICNDLISPASLIGPSLAMVTGPAGRGKTEAARHYSVKQDGVYIAPMITRTPTMVLREIAFELSGLRPTRTDSCLDIIGDEMCKKRRIIIIDEADLLELRCLEMLRNCNERFACPVLLIGEDTLKRKVASRRRLLSRMRRRHEFSPISKEDIVYFIQTSLGVKVTTDVLSAIHKYSGGDWRPVLTTAINIERAMKASDLNVISIEMVKNVIRNA